MSQVEAGWLDIQLYPLEPAVWMEQVNSTYRLIASLQGGKILPEAEHSTSLILVDEGRILQVLKKPVENALRYTPKGGRKFGPMIGEKYTFW